MGNMPHDHPYATVDQNEDAHASDPADEISISEDKQHLCRKTCAFRPSLTYFLVSGALLFLSFISGSVLHPVSLSNFNTIDRPHSQDQDGPRKFVPIREHTPIFKGRGLGGLLVRSVNSPLRDQDIRVQPDVRR